MKTMLLLALSLSLSLPAVAAPPPPDIVDELVLAAATPAPAPAFALAQVAPQEPAAPAPSVLSGLAAQFLTPSGIASIAVTILGVVAGLTGLSVLRKKQIAIVTQHAFHAVEDFAATTETPIDDKVAAGLKIADEWMRAQGWRPLGPDETKVVELGFTALNGSTKLAEKMMGEAVPPKA